MSAVQGPDRLSEKNEAFTRLVETHQGQLLRLCCLYLKDASLARGACLFVFVHFPLHLYSKYE